MDIHTVTPRCVALFLPGTGEISAGKAAEAVRKAQRDRGQEEWSGMTIDLFCLEEDCLIIAKPALSGSITLADYALPFLISHFGD